jgi:hypothetical protein
MRRHAVLEDLMRNVTATLTAALLLGLAAPALSDAAPAEASAEVDLQARIMLSLNLPTLAHELRVKGAAEGEVTATVSAFRVKEVAAFETAEVLLATVKAVDDKGPIENFGAFVKEQLADGKRGKDLADAIHAEHEKRGIGKGRKLGHFKSKKKDKGHDKPHDDEGKHKGHDKPHDDEGKHKGHDKPHDDKGKHKGHDKKKDKKDDKGKKGKKDEKGKKGKKDKKDKKEKG